MWRDLLVVVVTVLAMLALRWLPVQARPVREKAYARCVIFHTPAEWFEVSY